MFVGFLIISICLLLVAAIASFWLIVVAFREKFFWGMAYIGVPIVQGICTGLHVFQVPLFWGAANLAAAALQIAFVCKFRKARPPFFISLAGFIVGFGLLFVSLGDEVKTQFMARIKAAQEQQQKQEKPLTDDDREKVAADVIAKRQMVATMEAWIATENTALTTAYTELFARRNALGKTPSAEALAAYNAEAAKYSQRKTIFDTKCTEFTQLRSDLEELTTKKEQLAQTPSTDTRVVMYSKSWCPACKEARDYFVSKHIPFTDFDVEKDVEASAKFHKLGGDAVPLIIIKGQQKVGFDPNWVNSMVNG